MEITSNSYLSLLNHIVKLSEEYGFWVIESEIIGVNQISVNLHKKCGFRVIGTKEKIGQMDNGVWHDLILMEKRSEKIGK